MRTNYILIDYENVQPTSLPHLENEYFKVFVFFGENQKKIQRELVMALQRWGERGQCIEISGTGSNALDFHIAYYIGQLVQKEPDAFSHIISKDTGFDPLIQHLKGHGVHVGRYASVGDIPPIKADNAKTPAERLTLIKDWLRPGCPNKPRTGKKLSNAIKARLGNNLSDAEIAEYIETLTAEKFLKIEGTKVAYL